MLKCQVWKLDTAKTTDDELKWQQSTYWNWKGVQLLTLFPASHQPLHIISDAFQSLL